MSTYRLSELVNIVGGGTPSRKIAEYWGGTIPWATVKDFKTNVLSTTIEFITQAGVKNSATNIIPAGNIIVPTRMALGKAAINCVDLAINQDLKALIIRDKSYVDRNYLLRFLLSKSSFIEGQGKGATVKGITIDVLKNLELELPPLPEQRRIAAILDKADAIRRKRQQAIALTEQFLRSAFLEMFGNTTLYSHYKLTEISDGKGGIKCGPFGTQLSKDEYQSGGVPLWGIKHVNNHFQMYTSEFISPEKAIKLKDYSLLPGDIVMTRKGTVGNCSVYPDSFPRGIMHSDLLRLRLDKNKCLPAFLSWQLSISQDVVHQLSLVSSGAIMAGINVTKLKEIKVFVPPIEKQRHFERLEKKQSKILDRLRELFKRIDTLSNALTHRAFRGELTAHTAEKRLKEAAAG